MDETTAVVPTDTPEKMRDLQLQLVRTQLTLVQKEFALLDARARELLFQLKQVQGVSDAAVFHADQVMFVEPPPPVVPRKASRQKA